MYSMNRVRGFSCEEWVVFLCFAFAVLFKEMQLGKVGVVRVGTQNTRVVINCF